VIKVNDSLHTQLLRAQVLKKPVQALVFVKLHKLSYDLVGHGKVGRGVVKPRNHVPDIIAQCDYLLLQRLVLF
jgi:hypothetical protein